MKHNFKITAILLAMFLITQLIGIYVVNFYSPVKIVEGEKINVTAPNLPFGLETPELEEEKDFNYAFVSILLAFMIAISLLLFLTRLNAEFFLRLWFFLVIVIALVISFNVFISKTGFLPNNLEFISWNFPISWAVALAISFPLAYIKIYKRDFFVHNMTELIIYPGIAAVFVPILNIYTVSMLLILISIYDMWAVWHSGIMQKMAKYQINKLNIFSGFFVPYMSKKVKMQMMKMKNSKSKRSSRKKIKVNIAILGGGDVIFPIITSGVMLKTLGFLPALFVIAGATLGLSYLFFFAEKRKFYPAMPFISAGIFFGILMSYLMF
ncbi:MAG TPA: presenilin family intramembrane aspartyl protease [Candidatus Nanoarchaeia archaeon]|nr:presenilin family intramembrane aspartyl protease [Candidatus Nanoarchaeia archaeon]